MATVCKHLAESRRLAMLKAMEALETHEDEFCSKCAAWESKFTRESKRSCDEIQHLRSAVQKMLEQLAAYMSGVHLRAFAAVLRLDDRIFNIPGELDSYRGTPFPVEEQVSRKEFEQIAAERDIAKMRLSVLNKELQEMKSSRDCLEQRLSEQKRNDPVETSVQTLETQGTDCESKLRQNEQNAPKVSAREHAWSRKPNCNASDKLREQRHSAQFPKGQGDAAKELDLKRSEEAKSRIKTLQGWCACDTGPPKIDLSRCDLGQSLKKATPGAVSKLMRSPSKGHANSQPNLWSLGDSDGRKVLPMTSFVGPGGAQHPMLSKGRSSSKLTLLHSK